jgi:hypothetical protein
MKNIWKNSLLFVLIGFCLGSASATNVALNKPATASLSTAAETPERAFDGDTITNWCTPGFTGWVSVDLQNRCSIDSIRLHVNQYLPGNTVHEIKVSEDMQNWTTINTLSGYTVDHQVITLRYSPVVSNVRYVKVNTLSSNSWVAWFEIGVYGNPANPAAVSDKKLSNEVKVYPNPAKDAVSMEGVAGARIELVNLQGQVVKVVKVTDANAWMDVSELAAGLYTIKITTKEGTVTRKMVKK